MRYLGVATPTSTTIDVTRLAGADFMIAIEAVAMSIPEKRVRAVQRGGPASLIRVPARQVLLCGALSYNNYDNKISRILEKCCTDLPTAIVRGNA